MRTVSIGFAADWRDPEAYHALSGCDASFHAWEWLRRDPVYRAAFASGDAGAAGRFGMHRLEDPALCAGLARPIWMSAADPFVIVASASPSSDAGAFDLRRYAWAVRLHEVCPSGEHLILRDGGGVIRIDLVAGSLCDGPVRLTWHMPHPADALPAMMALRRLVMLCRTGRLIPSNYPSAAQGERWARLLRVADALAVAAPQREIARALFGAHLVGDRWRVDAASYRLRVQRLVRAARLLARAGGVSLLRPPVDWRG